MLIISEISAILSIIVYMLPFLIKWAKREKIYRLPKKTETIPNKWVFLTKLGVLALMIVIYVLAYPNKMMFYPPKTMLFILVLLILSAVTGAIFCKEWLNEIDESEMFKEWAIYALILFGIFIVTGCSWGNSDKEIIKCPEHEESIVYNIESINSSGLVFYHDDNGLQTLSIVDKNVSIEPNDESDTSYIKKNVSYEQYRNQYDKDINIIKGKITNESYTVYIPQKQLNELMK